jgi:hypothetical protein
MALNQIVEMVCPNSNCKHKHKRCIQNGVIFENGREGGSSIEEIRPPFSSYSKEPKTEKMKNYHYKRDGVVIDDSNMVADSFLKERWFELHGGKI